jgi:hypothetical protein
MHGKNEYMPLIYIQMPNLTRKVVIIVSEVK